MPRDTLIQVRRGTLSQWNIVNPTLQDGEIGFITDSCQLVIGDGLTDFSGVYSAGCVIGSGGGGGGGGGTINDSFKYINVSGQDLIVASGEATLNLLAGHGVNIGSVAATDTITFSVSGLVAADITDFDTAVVDAINTDLRAGDNIVLTYDVINDDLYINATGVVTHNEDGDVYIEGDLSVAGNFNVAGSSTVFNSTNVNIGDNIITLNIVDVVPSGGILIVRSGIEPTGYASLLWQENNSRWELSSGVYSPIVYADTINATTINGFLEGTAACANTINISGIDLGGQVNGLLLTNVIDSGCQTVVADTSLVYDASGQVLSATYFSGQLLGYANNAYRVDAVETSQNLNYNIVLVEQPGSGVYLFADGSGLYYNPSTNLLHVPIISGAPSSANINDYIIQNYTIKFSKIDGGTP
jgi:hypothetical protein